MIVIKFGKWSSRGGFRFYYERLYIKGKWTPFCKKEEWDYKEGGYIPWIGPIGRAGLKEIVSEAVVDENEEEKGMFLKECIRCNGEARLIVDTGETIIGKTIDAYIECSECRLRTRTHRSSVGSGEAVEKAIEDWNKEEWMRDGCE